MNKLEQHIRYFLQQHFGAGTTLHFLAPYHGNGLFEFGYDRGAVTDMLIAPLVVSEPGKKDRGFEVRMFFPNVKACLENMWPESLKQLEENIVKNMVEVDPLSGVPLSVLAGANSDQNGTPT